MIKSLLTKLHLAIAKQYTSIGGQAVIEGVMMRSPHSFVVAVRTADGKIRLRKDQWYGLSQKFPYMKKPFLRGTLVLFEAMANGIVSLNYSANIAMEEENRKKAEKKGQNWAEVDAKLKEKESINWGTFFTILGSLGFGIALFVLLPHLVTAWIGDFFDLNWSLDSFAFHAVDGAIKACFFILYIFLIGFLPDIRRVFQYHGAEHKSISTFEAGEELEVKNAKKYSTLHRRCGTSFIFFLLFISILIFSALFTVLPLPEFSHPILKHVLAVVIKVFLMVPVAGISYEIIKFAGKHSNNLLCRSLSFPGMMLQKLTTKEPDEEQLEVALASIKTALFLEERYNLKKVDEKILDVEEVDIASLADIQNSNATLDDFLEWG